MRAMTVHLDLVLTAILLALLPGIHALPKWLQPLRVENSGDFAPRTYNVYDARDAPFSYSPFSYGPLPTISQSPIPPVSSASETSAETLTSLASSGKCMHDLNTGVCD